MSDETRSQLTAELARVFTEHGIVGIESVRAVSAAIRTVEAEQERSFRLSLMTEDCT
jgi:hypothetical protein